MSLRTIKFYVVYDPKRRVLVRSKQFKKDIGFFPKYCVLVEMKGHYFPPRLKP